MGKTILNNGDDTGKYQTICSKCDCHFSFSENDTYKHTNYDRDGSSVDTYIDCPNCSYSILYAGSILHPTRGNGLFGGLSTRNIEQRVFNNVDVESLRSTKSDAEFKRLLIKFLK